MNYSFLNLFWASVWVKQAVWTTFLSSSISQPNYIHANPVPPHVKPVSFHHQTAPPVYLHFYTSNWIQEGLVSQSALMDTTVLVVAAYIALQTVGLALINLITVLPVRFLYSFWLINVYWHARMELMRRRPARSVRTVRWTVQGVLASIPVQSVNMWLESTITCIIVCVLQIARQELLLLQRNVSNVQITVQLVVKEYRIVRVAYQVFFFSQMDRYQIVYPHALLNSTEILLQCHVSLVNFHVYYALVWQCATVVHLIP